MKENASDIPETSLSRNIQTPDSQKTDNVNTSKTKKEVKSKDNEKNADKNKKISRHNTNAGSITFEFNRHTAGFIILIITFGVILFWGFNNTESLRGLVSYVFGLFSPLIIGCCMAFIFNVPLRAFEKLWKKMFEGKKAGKKKIIHKLKRPVCLTLSILLVFGLLFMLSFMILPEFKTSLTSIANSIPKYIPKIENWWDAVLEFADKFGAVLPDFSIDPEKIINMSGTVLNSLFGAQDGIVNKTLSFTTSLFTALANLFVALVFSVYLLAQKEKIASAFKKIITAFLPEKKVGYIVDIAKLTNQTFFSFVTGQCIEAAIIGILCFIGMNIFSIPYAAVISVLVSVTALIPVFGAFIGTAAGAFLILLSEPIKALWFIIFIIVLQQLEGNLIYPKVVGKSVGLPGIWVLMSVSVGGKAFGIIGMIISVPLCAVIYSLLRKTVYARLSLLKKNNEALITDEQEIQNLNKKN